MNEKPFSFYYRDKYKENEKKKIVKEDFENEFRIFANPVPESCKSKKHQELAEFEQRKRDENKLRREMIAQKTK